jgi:hypothetical protein
MKKLSKLSTESKTRILFILHCITTIGLIASFFVITKNFKPWPISDFKDYWDTSTDLQHYYKGGLLFLLYAPLKLLKFSPYWSSFLVNSFCFTILSYILWINKKPYWQLLSSCILFLTGIWFSGFIPIVNSDIPTIVF